MITAIDKGTAYTKTSELISFKSTIREYKENELNFSQDKIIVEYCNKSYVVGSEGRTNTTLFKSEQDETKLLVLAGYKVDLDISNIVNSYFQQIIQALEFDYNIPQIQHIFLTGGGGEFLHPYIRKVIPRIKLMDNPRFTNVLSYKLLCEVLFNLAHLFYLKIKYKKA